MQTQIIVGAVGEPVRFFDGTKTYVVGCDGDGDEHSLGPLSLRSEKGEIRPCSRAERQAILSAIVQRDDPRREYLPTYQHTKYRRATWWQMEVSALPSQPMEVVCAGDAAKHPGGEAVA